MAIFLLLVCALVSANPANGFSLDVGFRIHNVSSVDSRSLETVNSTPGTSGSRIVVTSPKVVIKELRREPKLSAPSNDPKTQSRALPLSYSWIVLAVAIILSLSFAAFVVYAAGACISSAWQWLLRSAVYVVNKTRCSDNSEKPDLDRPKEDNQFGPSDVKVGGVDIYPHLDCTVIPEYATPLEVEKSSRSEVAPGYKIIYSTGMPQRFPV